MFKEDLLPEFTEQVKYLCGSSPLAEIDFHIALSGGLDSVVLLHLFSRLRDHEKNLTIGAHHINHGLSVNASSWSNFCLQLCHDLVIAFTCSAVDLIKPNRTSLEALAREKRYACLTNGLSENSYLVSAHHQDDQLETVLLALKRGSGNTGLQGVRSKQKLKNSYLIRPLLIFSRHQLEQYAKRFNLQWIEDESNKDQAFDRNFIRHTISPLLKARWPAIAKTVARSASICQEQQQLLDEIAQLDFTACLSQLLNQQVINIIALKKLSTARRNNVLRYWFKENKLSYPSSGQLLSVWRDMVLASEGASPKMQFKGMTLRRYRDHLYLVEDQQEIRCYEAFIWQGEAQVSLLNDRLTLCFAWSKEGEGALAVSPDSQIKICFRSDLPTTLRCTPIGRSGSRSIKKLLHEYHVAPWLRDSIPFILVDGELYGAVGLWQCQRPSIADHNAHLTISFA